ncbi:ParB-like chromosome segregation protein Spo0J [Caldanaerobacter subterraneus subsp. tengcongensis MB4]|uniref:Predicted Transcriptional regulator n=2 Tax=Caldanaerobacter subterraneus TaxID=911092 RepID=Q8R5R0_CALS4|nr:predicted Transcriptional regulator [Caldanaerobacter subterraneus subsp. tengcongensis MB4]MCS3915186.1 ParB-like chromosome segregation protein Spo0J [Caldanaerobacter subterraneus subsp. tengcongensis MB4]
MKMISTNLLREHPRNKEFFDDIQGQAWQDFLESIKTSGIITPLIVTRNEDETYTVISGSQRLRAAKELGIEEVPCEVRTYKDRDGITKEDWILKDLIETNLRQRGKGNLNDLKLARCLVELMRIYGIRRGGDRKSELVNSSYQTDKMSDSTVEFSQSYLAELIGISERQLRRITRLNNLIPEIQQLIDEGKLSTTEGVQLAALDEEVQRKLYYALGEDINKMTAQQIRKIKEESEESIKELVDEINSLRRELQSREYTLKLKEEEISKKESLIKQYETAIKFNDEKIKRLENGVIKTVEVIPDNIKKELEKLKKEQVEAEEKLNLLQQELERTKREYEELKLQATSDEKAKKIIDEINRLNDRISTFREIASCSSEVREQLKNSILSLKKSLENALGSF